MRLIYCGNGNPRLAQIATSAGFLYGCQLPGKVMDSAHLHFSDQDWKKPNKGIYMGCLEKHRPDVASVLDWEREDQFAEVMQWAEEASQFVSESIIIIPKIIGSIDRIPRLVNGKRVILGYSVPTKFGATSVPWWEFADRPVHLLGGSPHRQMREWEYMSSQCDIVSADGNMANKMATRHCQYWQNCRWIALENHGHDAIYAAFELSCVNIYNEWKRLGAL